MTSPPRASRIASLDGLRGCAVVAVVGYHLDVLPQGFLGVDLFFVLSGFLITRILVKEHARTGHVRIGTFYVRRAVRLYPALVTVVLFCLAVAVITAQARATNLRDSAVSLLYVANIFSPEGGLLDHTWTLALEEQFYLVWPVALLFALSRRGAVRWAPATLVVVAILTWDAVSGFDGAAHTYVRAMGLPLGCALAFASPSVARRLGRAALPCAVALLVIVVVPLDDRVLTGWPVSLGAVLTVPVIAAATSRQVPVLSGDLLTWLGERSYSLYLWHFPLISLAGNHAPDAIPHKVALVLGAIASVVAADLSYRYVEKPILALRDRRTEMVGSPAQDGIS